MEQKKRMEIINKAILEAGKVFGVDPAYFGEKGDMEVDRQLVKMGYDPEDFRKE